MLPGVLVEAASPALIEKTRSVVTGADGQYRIVDLRPGSYTVTFTLAGFSTVRREGLELSGSLTATVDAEMRVGGVEETITVTGNTPLVDVQAVQRQWVLDKEIIDTLPTGRTTMNVAVLIPGMTLSTTFSGEGQDVGGNTGEVQQTLSIHGSRGGDMRRMVDGLSMQSQGTSVSAFAANSGMINEVTVDTAAGSAEQSAGGVRMNIIPREGGNTFSGSLFLAGTNEDLQSNNIDAELRALGLVSASSVKSNWEVNPAFGGPLLRDRLWFFASGRSASVNNYIANSVANANAGDRGSFAFAPDTSYKGSRDTLWQNVNARVTWQMNPKNKVSLFVDAQDRCSCIDSRALTAREASADFRFPWKRLVTATYTAPITNKILVEAGYAHKPEDWGYFTPEGLEQFEDFVGINNQATGVFYRGPRPYFMASMRFKAELMDDSWRAAVSYVTGAHAFKVGYQDHAGRTLGNFNIPVAANLSYTFNGLNPVSITQRAPYTSRDACPRRRRLRAGPLDDRQADAQSRYSLGLLQHELPGADAGPNHLHADAKRHLPGRGPREPQRHHAQAGRRVRSLRERTDGAQGIALEVRRAAHLHRHLRRLRQPGAADGAVGHAPVERPRHGLFPRLRSDRIPCRTTSASRSAISLSAMPYRARPTTPRSFAAGASADSTGKRRSACSTS